MAGRRSLEAEDDVAHHAHHQHSEYALHQLAVCDGQEGYSLTWPVDRRVVLDILVQGAHFLLGHFSHQLLLLFLHVYYYMAQQR